MRGNVGDARLYCPVRYAATPLLSQDKADATVNRQSYCYSVVHVLPLLYTWAGIPAVVQYNRHSMVVSASVTTLYVVAHISPPILKITLGMPLVPHCVANHLWPVYLQNALGIHVNIFLVPMISLSLSVSFRIQSQRL